MFSIFKKKENATATAITELKAFVPGKVIPIEEVGDGVFSSGVLGGGLAIEPTGNIITAPCDGTISVVMEESKHAVGMTLSNGAEILIHEGIETVNMNGDGFNLYVKKGQYVKEGDKLLSFDSEKISSRGLKTTCIFVLTNEGDFPNVRYITGMNAQQGETIIVRF